MKWISRAFVCVGISVLLTAWPAAAAQEKQSQDADSLRVKIEQFENKDLNSKSVSVRILYERTLLRLYNEFDSALQQDINELKEMQAAISGTRAGAQNDIALQIQKLQQERDETVEKIRTLNLSIQSSPSLAASPAAKPAPGAAAEQQPSTSVSYAAPAGNNARPATASIPLLDTLASNPVAAQTPSPTPAATPYFMSEKCQRLFPDYSKDDIEKKRRINDDEKRRLKCTPSGITGLLVGGLVSSQQEKNFSQSDPFFGFIAGYNSDPGFAGFVAHYRVQGIFQVQPQTASAPKAATAAAAPSPTPAPVDPANFQTFLASRKTFDIDLHGWVDRPFGRGVYRLGLYGGIGASTYIDKNELKGDETVSKTDGSSGAETKLDPTLGRASNDLKRYIEGGLIAHFLKDNGELFMQTQLLYGKYEALAGLVPGHDTRNRFIGRLRIFPTGLKLAIADPNKDSGLDMSPLFGVELNAGRGPDQLKFFTGIAISISRFGKPQPKADADKPSPAKPATGTGTGTGTSFQ
jgi:hypothetical protein